MRVLITGSSKGIGKAIAARFARSGHSIVINGRNLTTLERTRAELAAGGAQIHAAAGDICDEQSATEVVREAVAALGGLDLLINNAGIAMRGPFVDTRAEVWRRVLETNIIGTANITRAALGPIIASRGAIIFISSLVALWGFPQVAAYSASKMALDGLIESLRTETAGSGIRLCTVYVGIAQNDADKSILGPDGRDRSLAPRPGAMTQERVADRAYAAAMRRRRIVVLTFAGKMLALLVRFAPWILRTGLRLSARRVQKLSE